jgi:hypothetical protein
MIRKLEDYNKHVFYEMSNFRNKYTGLPMVIWIQPKTGKEQHYARIKVAKIYGDKISDNLFVITIEDNPKVIGDAGEIKQKDIKKAIEFIKLNKELLLDIWNDIIDPISAVEFIKKIL